MTGHSALILARFESRAILEALLASALKVSAADSGFVVLEDGQSAWRTASGETLPGPPPGDPGWGPEDPSAPLREPRRLVLPLILECRETPHPQATTGRPVPARLSERVGVIGLERSAASPPFEPDRAAAVEAATGLFSMLIASAQVSLEATTDRLTGLLNRGAFLRLLPDELAGAGRASQPVALLMFDIRRLDAVNRLAGREKGDEILRMLGRLLRERVRWRDVAVRYGGDEFLAAMPGAGEDVAGAVGVRLVEQFREEIRALGLPPVALNAGIAVYPRHGPEAGTLLDRADRALSAAKRIGPGRVLTWSEECAAVAGRADRLEGLLMGDPADDYARILTLFDTVTEVITSSDSEQLLRSLLDRMVEATDSDRAMLLRRGRSGELEVAIARDRGRCDLDPSGLRANRPLVERALLASSPAVSAREAGDDGPRGSSLAIPLRIPSGIVGVACLESREATSRYGAPRLAYLDALGHEVSLVLERNRLTDELAAKQEEIEALNRRLRARVRDQQRRIVAISSELERTQARAVGRADIVISDTGPMHEVFETIRSAARTDAPVLLTGETGAGKEVLAREVHWLSRRAAGPFIAVNCAAIPHTLIESELFGHARGAFTGAERERPGLFEEADGGTLLLDEIASTDLAFQAKLLRALQEGTIRRVGETADRPVDVRIVAAANVDLDRAIRRRELREDLYYRLAVFHVRVPPLRERPTDISVMARRFLKEACDRAGCAEPRLDARALALLARHRWPGNVRELRNVMERLAAACRGPAIRPEEVAEALGPPPRGREGDPEPDGGPEARARGLLEEMRATGGSFWQVARDRFLARELTREEMRCLVALGLSCSGGSYKRTAELFNLPAQEYKRFLDFLHNHRIRPRRAKAVTAARP